MKKYILLLAAVLATVCALPVIHLIQSEQYEAIQKHKLLGEQFAEEGGAPPGVAVSTVFLGGFRNILANTLWIRMSRLQEKGSYFELVQLANWILKVQPSNTAAAQYLAWNMAYNLSVIQQDFGARWRWVQKGLDTLMQAIELSPNDPMLYRDLAWIYQNKLGDQLDDASLYYKFRLASENWKIFGGRHSPDWQALTEMPSDWAQFRKKYPALHRTVSAYRDPELLLKEFTETGLIPETLRSRISSKEDLEHLMLSLQNMAIRAKLHIDPAMALDMEKRYGKLDWLLPDTFAIYWADVGLKKTDGRRNLHCERVRSHGLKTMFTSGRLVFPGNEPHPDFLRLPNLELMEAALAEYQKEDALIEGGTIRNMGHLTFIAQAIDTFYLFGRKKEAQKYFQHLRDLGYAEAHAATLDQYVNQRLRNMIDAGTHLQIQRLVESFVIQSAYALANGEREEAEQALSTARQIYELYQKRNRSAAEKERLRLPPFQDIAKSITSNLIRTIPALGPALKAELQLQSGGK